MRLLLDEQYSPEIATRLRGEGYDVTAVSGDPRLEGVNDEPLLRQAAADGRALLTNNVRDFAPLASTWAAGEEEHLGLIFTSDESLPRSRNTIGTYVERLRDLLDRNADGEACARSAARSPIGRAPQRDSLRGRVGWLT